MSRAASAQPTPSNLQPRAWSHEGASTTFRFAVALAIDRCLCGIRPLGFISMAGRAARCDRPGDGLGDPDLPRLRPGRADRLHGLHADHAALPRPIPGSAQWPVAGGRVASGDRRDRRSERGVGHRADSGADRGPLLRRAADGDPRRQQLHRPHRRGRRGDSAAPRSEDAGHLRGAGGKVAGAEHGAGERRDLDRRHRRRRHPPAPGRSEVSGQQADAANPKGSMYAPARAPWSSRTRRATC